MEACKSSAFYTENFENYFLSYTAVPLILLSMPHAVRAPQIS